MLITVESLKSLLKRDEHDEHKRRKNLQVVLESINATNSKQQIVRKKILNASKSSLYFPQVGLIASPKSTHVNILSESWKRDHEAIANDFKILDVKLKRIQKTVKLCESLSPVQQALLRTRLLHGVILVAKGVSLEKYIAANSSYFVQTCQLDPSHLVGILSCASGLKTPMLGRSESSTSFNALHRTDSQATGTWKNDNSKALHRSVSSSLEITNHLAEKLRPYLLPPLPKSSAQTISNPHKQLTVEDEHSRITAMQSRSNLSAGVSTMNTRGSVMRLRADLMIAQREEQRLRGQVDASLARAWSVFDLKDKTDEPNKHALSLQSRQHLQLLALEKLGCVLVGEATNQLKLAFSHWRLVALEHVAADNVRKYCKAKGAWTLAESIQHACYAKMRTAIGALKSAVHACKARAATVIIHVAKQWIQNRVGSAIVLQGHIRQMLAQRHQQRELANQRQVAAAKVLQGFLRRLINDKRRKTKEYQRIRATAAILVQKQCRGLLAKKLAQSVRESWRADLAAELRQRKEQRARRRVIEKQRCAEAEAIGARREAARQIEERLAAKLAKKEKRRKEQLNEMAERARQKKLLAAITASPSLPSIAPIETVKSKRAAIRRHQVQRHPVPSSHSGRHHNSNLILLNEELRSAEEDFQDIDSGNNFLSNLSSVPLLDIPLSLSLESEQPLSAVSLDSCLSNQSSSAYSSLQTGPMGSPTLQSAIACDQGGAQSLADATLLGPTIFTSALRIASPLLSLAGTVQASLILDPNALRVVSGNRVIGNKFKTAESVATDEKNSRITHETQPQDQGNDEKYLSEPEWDSENDSGDTVGDLTASGNVRVAKRGAKAINRSKVGFTAASSRSAAQVSTVDRTKEQKYTSLGINALLLDCEISGKAVDHAVIGELGSTFQVPPASADEWLLQALYGSADGEQYWNERESRSYWVH